MQFRPRRSSLTGRRRFVWLAAVRPPVLALGIVTVLAFVLVTGVTAALTVPAIAITAQEPLAQMLPADTAMYVTADVNPSSETRSALNSLGQVYSAQFGWSRVWDPFRVAFSPRHSPQCVQDTVSKAMDHLSDLGHDTAFAFLPRKSHPSGYAGRTGEQHPATSDPLSRVTSALGLGRTASAPSLESSLSRNVVILAPLDVRMTLIDALAGFSFSMPTHSAHYQGVSIYRESAPACSMVRRFIPDGTYYAAVDKGYVLLGPRPATLKSVIDAASGKSPSLATTEAEQLLSQLPSHQLGGFYVNGPVLDRPDGILHRLSLSQAIPADGIDLLAHAGVVAGSLAVSSNALTVDVARPLSPLERVATPPAGSLAIHMPAAASFYFTTRGMKPDVRLGIDTLRGLGVPLPPKSRVDSVLRDVNGELDLAQFPGGGATGGPRTEVFWQSHLSRWTLSNDLTRFLDAGGRANAVRHVSSGTEERGYGSAGGRYVAGRGWAMLSNGPLGVVPPTLIHPLQPLAGAPGYPATIATPGAPIMGLWYLNMTLARARIQPVLMSLRWPAGLRASIPLFLGPVQTVSGTIQRVPATSASLTTITITVPYQPAAAPAY